MAGGKIIPKIEATLFLEPVAWPDPVVRFHDGHEQLWGLGIKASTYASVHRTNMIRKYTRGECHAHALAAIEAHGGEVLALLQDRKVVHVFSLHCDVTGDTLILRDVIGDQEWPGDWEFQPSDFEDYADQHLLGCPIDGIIRGGAHPWPCPAFSQPLQR